MIPKINGTEERQSGVFVMPKERISFYGEQGYLHVLQTRLEKLGISAEWEQVETAKDAVIVARIGEELQKTQEINDSVQGQEKGAYRLQITPDQVMVSAGDGEGIANALTTLYWKLREGKGSCECGLIVDAPLYEWRGFQMDVCRHFFDAKVVKEMIEQCTLRKMNRMHWHLSDDQGFRVESVRFPQLNTTGSWRREEDGSIYGGFYTKEEVRDIVAYAKARGLEIVPEIDMPGHVSAMLATFPWLSCSKEDMSVPTMYGIHQRILCAGKDETLQFVYQLLDEVLELFPFSYVHIGGDEAPKSEWQKCPDCQARMRAEGLKSEEELQAWFTGKILDYLQQKGRTGICWNESLKSGCLDAKAVVQYWDEEGEDAGYCKELANGKRKCIYSFTNAFYFDSVPAITPLRRNYFCEPMLRGGDRIAAENLLGVEAELWSENIPDRIRLEQMAFPRMFSVAEKAWGADGDYEAFLKRCEEEIRCLSEDGIAHFTMEEADPRGEVQKQAILSAWKPMYDGARMMGAKQYEDLICYLVRNRIEGMLSEEEVEDVMTELQK